MLELSKLLSTISCQWDSCTQRPKASSSWGVSRNRLFSTPTKKKIKNLPTTATITLAQMSSLVWVAR